MQDYIITYSYMHNILKDFIYTQCPQILADIAAAYSQENKPYFRVQK